MSHPKVVIIGAGSLFFGRQALFSMIDSPSLSQGTLTYVDTNPDRLAAMMTLGKRAIAHAKSQLKLEGATDRTEVLKGADFVVLSFANDGVGHRGIDCSIALRHGIRMCSGDTIGPGGVFRAMRELPVILDIAKDIERLCPEAWVVNYVNPTAIHGIGLRRFAPKLKSFALCDSLHMPNLQRTYMRMASVEVTPANEADFELTIAGVNHFTWVLGSTFKGKDVSEDIRRSLKDEAAKETAADLAKVRFNARYALQLWDVFGCAPACITHTKEYVRYWQGHNIENDGIPPLGIFETKARQKMHDKMWSDIAAFNSGERPMAEFFTSMYTDPATDVIAAMWSGSKLPYYINTDNNGAVGNLPDDAFLELLCDVDMNGPRPRRAKHMPTGLRGLQMQVLDAHELTAEGVARSDRELLLRALCTDPLVNSIADARSMLDAVMIEARNALPPTWFQAKASAALG